MMNYFLFVLFLWLPEIPGTMQAFILAAEPTLQVIFLSEHKKAFFVDVIVFAFFQH
jgi:hypothetical protein